MLLSTLSEMKCKQNVLKSTDGSVEFSQGDTVVLVGAYGPADCKESKQDVKEAIVEVNFRPKIGIPGIAEKYLEQFVKGVCESCIQRSLHPRTTFSIIVQVIQDRGSLLSCAINGTSMALQDAGISMKFMPVAVTVALKHKEEVSMETDCGTEDYDVIFSPSLEEEEKAFANLTLVFDSVKSELVSTYASGPMTSFQYQQCLMSAKNVSKSIVQFFRDSVSKKLAADVL
uniref:Exosome complex component RRP46 n=1 Tax=Phallusia mammillata TaxID=59560 RepID=A0A6F9DD36_9ASCI|nr:exosome complex component RRP46 [Phallusia mammillata]